MRQPVLEHARRRRAVVDGVVGVAEGEGGGVGVHVGAGVGAGAGQRLRNRGPAPAVLGGDAVGGKMRDPAVRDAQEAFARGIQDLRFADGAALF